MQDPEILHADLRELRSRITTVRKELMSKERTLMMGAPPGSDENDAASAPTQGEVDLLRENLNELTNQERLLAREIEGVAFETVHDTVWEKFVDFMRGWGWILAACIVALVFTLLGPIIAGISEPTEQEAAEIRRTHQGQTSDDIDFALEMIEDLGKQMERQHGSSGD